MSKNYSPLIGKRVHVRYWYKHSDTKPAVRKGTLTGYDSVAVHLEESTSIPWKRIIMIVEAEGERR